MNQLIKEDNKEYQYDNRGRLIRVLEDRNTIKELSYNQDNKLVNVRANNNEVKFQYDGLAKLVAKEEKINNITKHTKYSINHIMPWNDILEEQQDSTNKIYTFDGLGIHSINNDRTMLDHLGTATNIITSNNENQHLSYDEFGNILNKQPDGYGYTGYLYDEISQLNYAQARFYNSQLGRFISEDNIVNNGIELRGFNRYNYVESNPLRYMDRDGNKPTVPNINPNINETSLNIRKDKKTENWGTVNDIMSGVFEVKDKFWEKTAGGIKSPYKVLGKVTTGLDTLITYNDNRNKGKTMKTSSDIAVTKTVIVIVSGAVGGPLLASLTSAGVDKLIDMYDNGEIDDMYDGMITGGKDFFKNPIKERNEKYGPAFGDNYGKCIE